MFTTVNFGSFAINNADGTCDLYMQVLQENQAQSTNVILGSMWMQNFNALFSYDNANQAQNVSLMVGTNTLPGTVINSVKPVLNQTNAFNWTAAPEMLSVSVNSTTMTASVMANLGYQGMDKFMLSMTTNLVVTFSSNCTGVGLGAASCDSQPNFAINYFNMSHGPQYEMYNVTVDGYQLMGNKYD